jgi:RNA polymerase-binding transcription factor DksA
MKYSAQEITTAYNLATENVIDHKHHYNEFMRMLRRFKKTGICKECGIAIEDTRRTICEKCDLGKVKAKL